jgi:hypothetical protein
MACFDEVSRSGVMKRLRRGTLLAPASLLLVGLYLLAARSFRSTSARSNWLMVSSPVFGSRTNLGQAFPTVSLNTSNVGPRRLDYHVDWVECRATSDYALLATNYGFSAWVQLPSGEFTILTKDLTDSHSSVGERLFCCHLSWGESEPVFWRIGWRCEPWVSQVMGIFNSQWVPPWVSQSRHRAQGDVFSSNISVGDYFRLVYGWTRSDGLETMARIEASKTQQVAFQVASRQRYGLGSTSNSTATDLLRAEARSVFAAFCQNSTNESVHSR